MNTTHKAALIASGAIGGALTAASVDYQAFKSWKSFQDATKYNWGTAVFRWVQGAVIGAVSAAGISQLM